MKLNSLFRLVLAVFFGSVGILLTRTVPPPELFAATGTLFYAVGAIAFGILGFISPDLAKLAGKAGLAAIAAQIADYLPNRDNISLFSRRKKAKYSGKGPNPMLIDTSALIDGRLVDVARTGFLFGTFVILPSVIDELHKLSDSADEAKRARGRRGLDNLDLLQHEKVKLEVLSSEPQANGVDAKLVKIAKTMRAKIVTVDFNLNKVAKVNKISVMNINELANSLKTPVLPSDKLNIKITAVGKEKEQGVGYLPDGTMVVVESGSRLVGKMVVVDVQKVLQTAAGKMVFARRAGDVN